MKKPASLRKAIGDALPDLRTNPDRMTVFVDAGKVISRITQSNSFGYQYKLNLIFEDFSDDTNLLFFTVAKWLREHQSDLFANPATRETALVFDVDHLTNETCDVSISINLTEDMDVAIAEDGAVTFTARDEPKPEWERTGLA